MIVEVKVPMLAESVADATLISWHKKPGDVVKRGDSLIDIETDKVTLEVAAPNNGVISEILKQDGEDVLSDEVIARIDTKPSASATPSEEQQASTESVPEQQSLPVLDESQAIDDAPVAEDLIKEEANGSTDELPTLDDAVDIPGDSPKLSPAVRNLIDNHDLKLNDIEHQDDRITKEDVLSHMGEIEPQAVQQAEPEQEPAPVVETAASEEETIEAVEEPEPIPEPAPEPTVKAEPEPQVPPVVETAPASTSTEADNTDDDGRGEQRVPMTRLRQRVAERLLNAQQENAILSTFNEVNMQPVMDLRARYKDEFEKTHGVKLGFMSFFCKAAVEALKKFPIMNASVDGKDILYHEYYDLGIAVSSPRGLVVPILRDADLLSLSDIELTISEFGEKAREGTLGIEDLTGGTFTITNGGVFGSLLSTPILNPPQSAILGMHKIQERPVAENGQVVIRPMMYLALSYDHRIIDGRDAVQFLVTIKEQLEDPARLLLQI